ncbi:MAG TPA: hypothetical protein VK846_05680 [Candidatus Limnocylindria bacterium]|nr:hypothetical protein [Candidatus Limnocylindria bacterium]
MNMEVGIKLQAYLDGELTERETQQVASLMENDADARALFGELQQTSTVLRANEPEFRLPESREFYWGKIESEIERLDTAPVPSASPGWILFLRRHLAAVTGTSAVAALMLFMALQMNLVSPALFEEIDNPLDDTPSFSFRSESQQMTLVWISNPFVDAEESTDGMPDEIQ